MATVRKRKWEVAGEKREAWIADYSDQAGKRHLKTFRTKKLADTWLVGARHQIAQGTHTAETGSITIAVAAELWIEAGETERLERSTLKQYRNHIKHHLAPLIGDVTLAKLTAPAVEKFRDDLLKTRSRPMAKKILASLKSIVSEAQRRGLVGQNAALPVSVDMKKRDKRRLVVGKDIPTKAEINTLLQAAAGALRPLLTVSVFTGLRSSELRGLTWNDVDFDTRVLHVRQRADAWGTMGSPKSGAGEREIPMAPSVFNALREWKLECPRVKEDDQAVGVLGLVFPNGAGKVENHANIVNRGLAPLQVSAGVSVNKLDPAGKPILGKDGKAIKKARYGMHAFRHFFASWVIEQGFSPKRIQSLLGHSSIQMTFDVYGHLFPSLEDDHAKFAAAELAIVG